MAEYSNLKFEARQTLTNPDTFLTKHVGHQVNALDNYADHLKLDREFLNTASGWREKFDPLKLQQHSQGSRQVSDNSSNFLRTYRGCMKNETVASLTDNQFREGEHAALSSLATIRSDLHPFARDAHERINQFSDEIGVTDRYTGYRANMSRSRQLFKLDTPWARRSLPPARSVSFAPELIAPHSNGRFHIPVDRLSGTASARSETPAAALSGSAREYPAKSPAEAAGVNTTFPGNSEYMTAFKPPCSDQKKNLFAVNPTVEYEKVYGRSQMQPPQYSSLSEYTSRYEWPQVKAFKLPFVRAH